MGNAINGQNVIGAKVSWLQGLKREPLNAHRAQKGMFEIWVSKTLHTGDLDSMISHTHTRNSQYA